MAKWLDKVIKAVQLRSFRKERSEFYRNLAECFENNEQLKDFLLGEYEIARDKKTKNTSKAYALRLMLKRLALGEEASLSSILRDVMPAGDALMLTALDDTKNKPETFRSLADAVEQQSMAVSIVKKSVIKPMVILPGIGVFVYVLAVKSIPIIVDAAPASVWTPYNMAVRRFAEFFASQWGMVLVGLIAAILLGFWLLPNWTGSLRSKVEGVRQGYLLLLFPVFPYGLLVLLYKDFQVTQLMSALSVMIRSGQSLMAALDSIKDVSTPYMRYHLRRIISYLQQNPTEYVNAFSRGFLNPMTLGKMATAIRTKSSFDEVLIVLGTDGAVKSREVIQKTADSLNSVIMIIAACIVIFLYTGQLNMSAEMQNAYDMTSRGIR
jgi:type II secretory pathway component PulF